MLTSFLTATATKYILVSLGGAVAAPVLGWLLKKIPTDKLKAKVGVFFFGLGKAMTYLLGAKLKYTKPVWNHAIEPWFVVVLESIVSHGLSEFTRGLKTDNPEDYA